MNRTSDVIDGGLIVAAKFSDIMHNYSDGISLEAAKIMRITMNSITDELGLDPGKQVAIENFASKYSNRQATMIAMEEADGFFVSIWKALKDFISRIWNGIMGLFGGGNKEAKDKKNVENAEKNEEKAKVLEAMNESKASKDASGKEVEDVALIDIYNKVAILMASFTLNASPVNMQNIKKTFNDIAVLSNNKEKHITKIAEVIKEFTVKIESKEVLSSEYLNRQMEIMSEIKKEKEEDEARAAKVVAIAEKAQELKHTMMSSKDLSELSNFLGDQIKKNVDETKRIEKIVISFDKIKNRLEPALQTKVNLANDAIKEPREKHTVKDTDGNDVEKYTHPDVKGVKRDEVHADTPEKLKVQLEFYKKLNQAILNDYREICSAIESITSGLNKFCELNLDFYIKLNKEKEEEEAETPAGK